MDEPIMDGPALDAFSAHEVLHSSFIVAAMFDEYVAGHGYTRSDPMLAVAADRLSAMLHDFYQQVGAVRP